MGGDGMTAILTRNGEGQCQVPQLGAEQGRQQRPLGAGSQERAEKSGLGSKSKSRVAKRTIQSTAKSR